MKFLYLSLLSFFCLTQITAQVPFNCDDNFFIVFADSKYSDSEFYIGAVDSVQYNDYSYTSLDIDNELINAIGYRRTDNFIYGVEPYQHKLYKLDATGKLYFLKQLNLPSYFYSAGAISPDGRYYYILGSQTGGSAQDNLTIIDLSSANYSVSHINLTLKSNGNSNNTRVDDIAIHPITGICYGHDRFSNKIIEIDLTSGEIDNTQNYPTTNGTYGGLFFSNNGSLIGYGSSTSTGQLQNELVAFDLITGNTTFLANTYRGAITDACSCPKITYANQPNSSDVEASIPQNIERLAIGPNPNSGMLNIDIELKETAEYNIMVFDNLGRKVYNYISSEKVNALQIDINNEASGHYVVAVETQNQFISKSILMVKQ